MYIHTYIYNKNNKNVFIIIIILYKNMKKDIKTEYKYFLIKSY